MPGRDSSLKVLIARCDRMNRRVRAHQEDTHESSVWNERIERTAFACCLNEQRKLHAEASSADVLGS